MGTIITPEELYFGAPASLQYGGIEVGATMDAPMIGFDITAYKAKFQGARGPVKGTVMVTDVIPYATFRINQVTAQKMAWAMPGATSTSSASIGQVLAGLNTTLAADPALGATNLKMTSVTTVTVGQFIRIGPVGTESELNSEVVQAIAVGTTGAGGTGVDIVNDAGGGLRIDHANAEGVVTVNGTTIAAPAAAGSTNVKVVSVANLIVGDFVRFGYSGHYETRVLTVVGTTGAGGTGLTFAVPLSRDHSVGEWAIEVTAQGGSTIGWTPGRVPSAAYQNLVLTGLGLDGRTMVVTILNAMSAQNMTLNFSDSEYAGLPVRFDGYYDPTTPTVAPFTVQLL